MKELVKKLSRKLGVEIIDRARAGSFLALEKDAGTLMDIILNTEGSSVPSRAQLKQDIFVLIETRFKRNGFFVEFGATNGIDLSNTWLLEKEFGWTGILAEPANSWHEALKRNRTAKIETKCAWSRSGETLKFTMANEGEYSTISEFTNQDSKSFKRRDGTTYPVETISLLDLLKTHDAPTFIDYLSIDTEGSEYDILQAFDFDAYRFGVITVEHNYTGARDRIHDLLSSAGYRRKFDGLSMWDDWYVQR